MPLFGFGKKKEPQTVREIVEWLMVRNWEGNGEYMLKRGTLQSWVQIERVDMTNGDLSHLNISYLAKTVISQCNLSGANCEGIILNDANLSGSWFIGANLREAHFSGSDCRGCDFTDADLSYATFNNVDFTGARMIRANLTGAKGFSRGGPPIMEDCDLGSGGVHWDGLGTRWAFN